MPLLIQNRIWDLDTTTGISLDSVYADRQALYDYHYDHIINRRFNTIISTVDQVSASNDFAKLRSEKQSW